MTLDRDRDHDEDRGRYQDRDREAEFPRRIEFSKRSQISAPSDKQILKLLKGQVEEMDRRHRFNGDRVTQQIYLNALVVAMEVYGDEFVDAVYRTGAAILAPANIADELHAPPGAGRPLRKQVAEARERLKAVAPPPAPPRPLLGQQLPPHPQPEPDAGGKLKGEDGTVPPHGKRPRRK